MSCWLVSLGTWQQQDELEKGGKRGRGGGGG
jgi:hypothetical protein